MLDIESSWFQTIYSRICG